MSKCRRNACNGVLTNPGQPGLSPAGRRLGGLGALLGTGYRRAAGRGEGRVVDQNCDGAQRISRRIHQPDDVVSVGQIGPDRHRASAGRLDVGDRLTDGARQPVVPHLFGAPGDGHRRAVGRERQRDRPAQAAAAAGDDRGPARKSPRHPVTPCTTMAVV